MFKITEKYMLGTTEEQLKALEAQGADVSLYRELNKKADSFTITNNVRLKELEKTPRNSENEIVKEMMKSAPLFGKGAYKDAIINNPLVYGCIVQAGGGLFAYSTVSSNFNIVAVFVFATDEKHYTDGDLLKNVASKLHSYKKSIEVPEDCKKVVENLIDTRSQFCLPVGKSITGDADVWCATYVIKEQKDIPFYRAPLDHLLPFVLKTEPNEKQKYVDFIFIKGNVYRKEGE